MLIVDRTKPPLGVRQVVLTLAMSALLVLLTFPSTSRALQEDGQTQLELCNYTYDEYVTGNPCTPFCGYDRFIAETPCTKHCNFDYDRFIAGTFCYCDFTYDQLIAGDRCPLVLYSTIARPPVVGPLEGTQADNDTKVQTVPSTFRPIFGQAAAISTPGNDGAATAGDATDSATAALSTSAAALAITGADDRVPLGGVILLGLGSFCVAVSRSRSRV